MIKVIKKARVFTDKLQVLCTLYSEVMYKVDTRSVFLENIERIIYFIPLKMDTATLKEKRKTQHLQRWKSVKKESKKKRCLLTLLS